jgi:cytoskeletal protein CcmA (bactofilin family)
MADTTVIGRGTRVRGRVSGAVDLEIQGHVDGEVAIDGDVTVDAQGLVGASVTGRRLVVRGAVKGDLTGEEAVLLEDGARVVGDVRAPRVAIAQGALVRGYVQTSGAQGKGGAARSQAARAAAPAAVKPASAARPVAPKAVPAPPKSAPAVRHVPASGGSRPTPVALAGGHSPKRAPPPPVVPALKKTKAALHKKKG